MSKKPQIKISKRAIIPLDKTLVTFLDKITDPITEHEVLEAIVDLGLSGGSFILRNLGYSIFREQALAEVERYSSTILLKRTKDLLEVGMEDVHDNHYGKSVFTGKDNDKRPEREMINYVTIRAKETNENRELFTALSKAYLEFNGDCCFEGVNNYIDPLYRLYKLLSEADFSMLVRDILELPGTDKEAYYRFFNLYHQLVPKVIEPQGVLHYSSSGEEETKGVVITYQYGLHKPVVSSKVRQRTLWDNEMKPLPRHHIPSLFYIIKKEKKA